MIRAAVVGLGIGLAHCAGYLKSPHAKLAAVCDPVEVRRETVGGTFSQGSMIVLKSLFPPDLLPRRWEELGVKTYTTLEEVLEDPNIHLVSLCTPPHTHPSLGAKVLNAGKHLYLEKPIGVQIEDCQPLWEAASRSPCEAGIAYEFRLNPAILWVRQAIQNGRIGHPEAFSINHYRNSFRRDKVGKWIQKREYSGGLLVEETCHWFDLARYLMGREVETLHCLMRDCFYPDFDFEDIAYVNGTFQGGGILQISHALTGFDFSLIIQVHGTAGTIWCALKEDRYSALDGGETAWYGLVAIGPLNGKPEEAEVTKFGTEATEPETIQNAVIHFTQSIALGQTPAASLEDGYRSLELSLMAGRSAIERKVMSYVSLYPLQTTSKIEQRSPQV